MHAFGDNPFGCKFVPLNGKAVVKKCFFYLLSLVAIPLFLLLVPLFYSIIYGIYCCLMAMFAGCTLHEVRARPLGVRIVMSVLLFVFSPVVLALGVAGGVLGCALGALAIVPVLVFHSAVFFRSIYWWQKNRGLEELN